MEKTTKTDNKVIMLKPIVTEKAVMKIESENTLTFLVDKRLGKNDVKKELEDLFDVKIKNVRSSVRGNKKYIYAKLNEKFPAIDVATKLGVI